MYDCTTCGACCAFAPDWPTVVPDDEGPDGPPAELVDDGHMRWAGDRCVALQGEVGRQTACAIYLRRPATCRACEAGSESCHVARLRFGLPIVAAPSSMEGLLDGDSGGRPRLGRRS